MQISQMIMKQVINIPVENENSVDLSSSVGALASGLSAFDTLSVGSSIPGFLGGVSGMRAANSILSKVPKTELISFEDMHKPETAFTKLGMNIGLEALIYGGMGVIKQGYGLAIGKQDLRGAAANVTADVMTGAIAGVSATATSSLTAHAMKGLNINPTVKVLSVVAAGFIGGKGTATLMEMTDLRENLVKFSGSEKDPINNQPESNPIV